VGVVFSTLLISRKTIEDVPVPYILLHSADFSRIHPSCLSSVPPHRYFTCRPNHGTFVRPDRVVVGDYPEIDEFASEDEDEEEV
jgi:hypothetical protein